MTPTQSNNRNSAEQEALKALGSNIRKWRENKKLTQEQFAPLVGFTRSYITEIETGKRNISFLNLTKIARVLEVNISEIKALFDETGGLE